MENRNGRMTMKKLSFVLCMLILPAGVNAQGIPTYDYTQAMNMVRTIKNDAEKIAALQSQVKAWQQQIQMNTGMRGMGTWAKADAVLNIPSTLGNILGQAKYQNARVAQVLDSVNKQLAVLTPEQRARMPKQQAELIDRSRNLAAIQRVSAETSLNVVNGQLKEIQNLQAQIDQAQDPKAIADLNAAISAKNAELVNTQTQLAIMDQQIQAEQKAIEQQQMEMVAKMLDNSQPSTIHIR